MWTKSSAAYLLFLRYTNTTCECSQNCVRGGRGRESKLLFWSNLPALQLTDQLSQWNIAVIKSSARKFSHIEKRVLWFLILTMRTTFHQTIMPNALPVSRSGKNKGTSPSREINSDTYKGWHEEWTILKCMAPYSWASTYYIHNFYSFITEEGGVMTKILSLEQLPSLRLLTPLTHQNRHHLGHCHCFVH